MIFTEDSVIVKSWVRLIKNDAYDKKSIPNLGNLRDVVINILDNNTEN